jgi:Tfp pilus assembly protein PilO
MKMRFVSLIAVSLVVLIAWFALAFKPARSKLADVRADVKTTQDEVAQLTAKLQELQNLKANEKELRAEFKKFANALPVEPALSDFILSVQDAADQAGIDFLSITPSLPAAAATEVAPTAPAPSTDSTPDEADAATAQAAAPVSPLQSIAVSLTADGKFFEIENFVAKMEKLERAVRVDDFTLSAGGGSSSGSSGEAAQLGPNSSPKISLSIRLRMFMNTPTAPATSGTTSGATTSGS